MDLEHTGKLVVTLQTQIDPPALMVLRNHRVLDALTAEVIGACAIIGGAMLFLCQSVLENRGDFHTLHMKVGDS